MTTSLRLTTEEADMLRRLAEARGVSASDILRMLLRDAFDARFPATKKRSHGSEK